MIEEIIKNILYYSVLIIGSTSLICLLISGLIRSFCFMLDHLKIGNVLRETLQIYIKIKKEINDRKITEADIKKALFKGDK